MGGKYKIAKHILPIILQDKKEEQYYVEPFAGGMNVIDKVSGLRIANDTNKYLIATYKHAVEHGEVYDYNFVNQQFYNDVMQNTEKYEDWIVGYVLIGCSFGGKWRGGYAKETEKRNYSKEAYSAIIKQSKKMKGVVFSSVDYRELVIPSNSIIYCDPPYAGTTGYNNDFDHIIFWDWVRTKSREGHSVYISELTAPDDFECLWKKETNYTVNVKSNTQKATEKLFKWRL